MNALPWQEAALDRLASWFGAGGLPHALALLDLPEGLPITDVAHPDFRWIEPDRGMLKVDQIRELSEFSQGTPQIAPIKLGVLLHAHLLNVQAANALLKTLEEPPASTHLLLVTEYFTRLMPTVRSRCQVLYAAPDAPGALAHLRSLGVEIDDATYAEFGHAPMRVLNASEDHRTPLRDWLDTLARGRLEVSKEQLEHPELLLDRWIRVCSREIAQALDGRERPAALALIDFQNELLDTRRQVTTTASTNVGLVFDRLMHRWMKLARQLEM